jgi:ribonuclease E
MLINAQRPEEVRIAIITGDKLDQYEVAATESGLCRGNIYTGTVANVVPSLDAAFVDFGEDRDGLLRSDDIVPSAYSKKYEGGGKHPRVDRIVQRGQPILVQVVRDAIGHKGAQLTTNISIAGRYLVLMPFDDVRGISRKAEGEDRQAVKDRVAKLQLPDGVGVILRTNALDQPQKTLNRDLSALLRLWKKIRAESTGVKGTRLLYSDQDLIVQALRDSVDASITEVLVDDKGAFAKAQNYMRTFMPRSGNRLVHYTDRMPLFSRYNLEEQIERIYQRKVDLPSGGSIVIEGTEALTAIDVNSGRSNRGASQEVTALTTDTEAAHEVARQLRLRDIGGLVVVDFIDMRSPKNRRTVEKAMRDALKSDKARTKASRISENGLLEINRQRIKKALQLRTHRPCPTCSGTGGIASPELVGLSILRRIETRAVSGKLGGVRVELHPELADAIQNERRAQLFDLEREFHIEIEIIAAPDLHRAEERIEWRERAKGDHPTASAAVTAADLGDEMGGSSSTKTTDQEAEESTDRTDDKPKPRKRRRGGRRRKKSSAAKTADANGENTTNDTDAPKEQTARKQNAEDEAPVKKSRRGGRRRKKKSAAANDANGGGSGSGDETSPSQTASEQNTEQEQTAKKSRRRRPRRKKKSAAETDEAPPTPSGRDPFAY